MTVIVTVLTKKAVIVMVFTKCESGFLDPDPDSYYRSGVKSYRKRRFLRKGGRGGGGKQGFYFDIYLYIPPLTTTFEKKVLVLSFTIFEIF